MNEITTLYRGVSSDLYVKLNGILLPKEIGKKFSSFARCGSPHATCGSGVICGESITNESILHQWGQKGYPTSGISTTPYFERAKYYSPANGKFSVGFIYELSIKKLKEFRVSIYRVSNFATFPAIPEDDEHILVAHNFKEIPAEAIINMTKIKCSERVDR